MLKRISLVLEYKDWKRLSNSKETASIVIGKPLSWEKFILDMHDSKKWQQHMEYVKKNNVEGNLITF